MADPVLQNWRDVYSTMSQRKETQTFDKNLLLNCVTHLDVDKDISAVNNLYDIHISKCKTEVLYYLAQLD